MTFITFDKKCIQPARLYIAYSLYTHFKFIITRTNATDRQVLFQVLCNLTILSCKEPEEEEVEYLKINPLTIHLLRLHLLKYALLKLLLIQIRHVYCTTKGYESL